MKIWISRNGQNYGPYTLEQLHDWLLKAQVSQLDLAWHQGSVWRPLGDVLRDAGYVLPPPPQNFLTTSSFTVASVDANPDATVRRIADYQRLSGILWIVIGVLQCITLIGIIAGIWNIFAGISRIRIAPLILQRDRRVPAAFEGVMQLVIIALINMFVGGIIGVVFVVFDFVVRDMVLKNRHLFEKVPAIQTE
jgi:hypothetical protein